MISKRSDGSKGGKQNPQQDERPSWKKKWKKMKEDTQEREPKSSTPNKQIPSATDKEFSPKARLQKKAAPCFPKRTKTYFPPKRILMLSTEKWLRSFQKILQQSLNSVSVSKWTEILIWTLSRKKSKEGPEKWMRPITEHFSQWLICPLSVQVRTYSNTCS